MQILELTSILEVVAGLELDIVFERTADVLHDFLNVCVAHVHSDYYASLRGIAVDLQRTVDEVDGDDFAYGYLCPVDCTHEQAVEIEVAHFLAVEADYEVKAPLVFEDHTCRFASVGCAYDVVQLLDVDTIACELVAVEVYYQLGQPHGLLHDDIRCATDFGYVL